MTHIMENIIYNELIIRGCAVDVGIVHGNDTDKKGRTVQVPRKIDFVATIGGKRVYIQSAYALPDDAKTEIENRPFGLTGDSFPKIIVRHDIRKRRYISLPLSGNREMMQGELLVDTTRCIC